MELPPKGCNYYLFAFHQDCFLCLKNQLHFLNKIKWCYTHKATAEHGNGLVSCSCTSDLDSNLGCPTNGIKAAVYAMEMQWSSKYSHKLWNILTQLCYVLKERQ